MKFGRLCRLPVVFIARLFSRKAIGPIGALVFGVVLLFPAGLNSLGTLAQSTNSSGPYYSDAFWVAEDGAALSGMTDRVDGGKRRARAIATATGPADQNAGGFTNFLYGTTIAGAVGTAKAAGLTGSLGTNDRVETEVDTPVVIDVLANDGAPDIDFLTVTGARQPANGTVTITNGRDVTYTPDAGFIGTDSFTYGVRDVDGHTDTVTVTVAVGSALAVDPALRRFLPAVISLLTSASPEIAFTAPSAGALLNTDTPGIAVTFRDVDTTTLRIKANGAVLPVNCVFTGNSANCSPGAALPQGVIVLTGDIKDLAGNLSNQAQVAFTVDSIPPVITVDAPADGSSTNLAQQLIRGTLNETASLTINGQPVSVGAGNEFSHRVTLANGLNTLELVAVDAVGNVGELTLGITLNQAPSLSFVGDRTISLGSVLEIQLSATDPDDDPLTYSATPLPLTANASLNATTGRFTFRPDESQIGVIPVTFAVGDGLLNDLEAIDITVTEAPLGTPTSLAGRLLDTNDFVNGVETPVVGAIVSLLNTGISATSDANGEFTLTPLPSGDQILDIDTSAAQSAPDGAPYAGFREKTTLIFGVANVLARPFFIPRIAQESIATVDPATTTMVRNTTLGIELEIPPNTAKNPDGSNFTGDISISEVPKSLAPVELPENLQPGLLITIQPVGVTFDTPVPIAFPNIDNLLPGSETDIWSLDPETGTFVIVGTGRVTTDGTRIETISGGVRAADWHATLSPAGEGDGGDNNGDNLPPGCSDKVGSETSACTGNLIVTHALPGYRSLGQARMVRLVYNSLHADPKPVIVSNTTILQRAAVPQSVSARISVAGVDQGTEIFTDTGGLSESVNETIRQAIQFDASGLATGRYPHVLTLTSNYARSSVSSNLSGSVLVNNQQDSPFGAGWTLDGLQRLHLDSTDNAVITEGDGSILVFRTSRAGFALRFDGVDDFVEFGNTMALGQNTFEQWVRPLSESGGLIHQGGGPSAFCFYGVALSGSRSQMAYDLNPNGCGNSNVISVNGDFFDRWTHIAGTYDGTTQRLYVNGRLVAAQTGVGFRTNPWTTLGATLFATGYQGGTFLGFMDEIRLWDHARTPEQIRETMRRPLTGTEAGLVAYWNFNEGSGQAVNNVAPSSFNGVLGTGSGVDSRDPTWVVSDAPLDCDEAECRFASPPGDFSVLVENTDGTFTRTLKDGTRIAFDAAGLHKSTVDRNGNATTYSYDANRRLIGVTGPKGLVTTLTYTAEKLDSITGPAARTTVFEHDATGNLTRIIDPDSTSRRFEYDSHHRMISNVSKRGFATSYAYDFAGRFRQSNLPDGSTRQLSPQQTVGLVDIVSGIGTSASPAPVVRPDDVVSRFTDGNSNVTGRALNRFGAPLAVTDALGRQTTSVRDDDGNPTRVERPNGRITTMTYDSRGNLLTKTEGSNSATVTFTYEPEFNRVSTVTDAENNPPTTIDYDANGNPIEIIDALGTKTVIAYGDSNCPGLSTRVTSAFGTPVETTKQFFYDPTTCNLIRTINPLLHESVLRYDGAGNVSETIDAKLRTTRRQYDALNRLTKFIDATNLDPDPPCGVAGVTCSDYDAAGNLIRITDARGNMTAFAHDALDRVIETTDPSGNGKSIAYEPNGDVAKTIDRKDQTIDFEYNNLNQLTRKIRMQGTADEEIITFDYDEAGNMISAVDSDSVLTMDYDELSRLKSVDTAGSPSQPSVLLSYTYDKNGNRRALTEPTGQTTYTYDALNRLTSLTNPSLQPVIFQYDKLNRRVELTHSNGIATTYSYDDSSQLLNLSHNDPVNANLISSFTYTYDEVGNRISLAQDRSTLSVKPVLNYAYDSLNQLTQATNSPPALPDETFQYDPVGNRVLRDGRITPAQFDSANRLIEDEDFCYGYDLNGNLITKEDKVAGLCNGTGQLTAYNYDPENRLIAVRIDGVMIGSYRYDALGRRIEKDTAVGITRYVYDNEDILLEYDDTGFLHARYTHGPGIDEPLMMERDSNVSAGFESGEAYAYHVDALGSVMDMTGPSGSPIKSLSYDSFGAVSQAAGDLINPYGYTAREFDVESKLNYYRARYYDSNSGRFVSQDPIGLSGGDVNFYRYVNNRPTNDFDPFGLLKANIGVQLSEFIVYIRDLEVSTLNNRINVNNINDMLRKASCEVPFGETKTGAFIVDFKNLAIDFDFNTDIIFHQERVVITINGDFITRPRFSVILQDIIGVKGNPIGDFGCKCNN